MVNDLQLEFMEIYDPDRRDNTKNDMHSIMNEKELPSGHDASSIGKWPPFVKFLGMASTLLLIGEICTEADHIREGRFGWTALFVVLLISAVGSGVILFKHHAKLHVEYERLRLRADSPTFGPIWEHIMKKMKDRKDGDFLIHALYHCPHKNEQPSRTPLKGEDLWTCVAGLWAHAGDVKSGGGSIAVTVGMENNVKHFNIRFKSFGEQPSNVTIRPCGGRPYARMPEENALSFEAKIPTDSGGESSPEQPKHIALTFRIVDRLTTHWFYKQSEGEFRTAIISNQDPETNQITDRWTPVHILLDQDQAKAYGQSVHWKIFDVDGNHRYPKDEPDIKEMILGLVIEVGGKTRVNRPLDGEGCLLIRNIRFNTIGKGDLDFIA